MKIIATLTGALSIAIGSASAATTYDAVAGFSTTNPGAIWSYQAHLAGAASYIGTYYTNDPGLGDGWWTHMSLPYSATVWVNKTGATETHLTILTPTSTIGMDPEGYDWVSVTFTAPRDGAYQFDGEFIGIDRAQYAHFEQIVAGNTTIFSTLIDHYGQVQSFSPTLALARGDRVSFRTLTGAIPSGQSTSNLATGLHLNVLFSAVPEPASWAMMLAGFGLVGAAARRRQAVRFAM